MGKEEQYVLYAKQSDFEWMRRRPWACGPTALYTALKILGRREVTFEQILRLAGTSQAREEARNLLDEVRAEARRKVRRLAKRSVDPKRRAEVLAELDAEPRGGLGPEDLARAARRLGVQATCRRIKGREEAWKALCRWGRSGRPAILAVRNGGHWVLAYGADRSGAWVMDPYVRREGFGWRTRGDLLARWYDQKEREYFTLVLRPVSARARALAKRYGLPPSDVLFEQIDHEEAQGEAVELRESLAEIFDDVPQVGQPAHRLFERYSNTITRAISAWIEDVDEDWLRDQARLMRDFLRGLPYRVPARFRERFLVDATVTLAVDALIAAGAEAGSADEDELLTYEQDANALLGRKTDGPWVASWFGRRKDLIADRIAHWVQCATPGEARRHLGALLGAAGPRRVGRDPFRLIVETTALVTAYCWYSP